MIATGPAASTAGGDPDGVLGAAARMARQATARTRSSWSTAAPCNSAADRLALRAASHVAWVLPATRRRRRAAPNACSPRVPDTAGAAS